MKQHNRTLGAAHHGPATGQSWMRAPLLAPEGDESAGSTGSTAVSPAETPSPAAANVVKTFTQEEVNRIAANAREEGRKAASKPSTGQQQVASPATATVAAAPTASSADETSERVTMRQLKEQIEALTGKLQVTEHRAAFDKVASKFEISEEQANDYFALSQSAKPPDLKAWIESKGFKPISATTGTSAAAPVAASTPPQATAATASATAPSAPSGPVSPTTQQGLVDLFALTEQQLAQLGPSGLRQHFEAALKVGRQQQGLPQRPQAPARK